MVETLKEYVGDLDVLRAELNTPDALERFEECVRQAGWVCVVLAAGQGSRFVSETPKVLHEFNNAPLVAHAVRAALSQNAPVVVVVGPASDGRRDKIVNYIRTHFNSSLERIAFAVQPVPMGTGHAVYIAKQVLSDSLLRDPKQTQSSALQIAIVYADTPGIDGGVLSNLRNFHAQRQKEIGGSYSATILTGSRAGVGLGAAAYGRIIRRKGRQDAAPQDAESHKGLGQSGVIDIVERKQIDRMAKDGTRSYESFDSDSYTKQELLDVDEFNSGIVLAQAAPYLSVLGEVLPNQTKVVPEPKFEYYATDFVVGMARKKLVVDGCMLPNDQLWKLEGANTVEELTELQDRSNARQKRLRDPNGEPGTCSEAPAGKKSTSASTTKL